jgi:excisionase family DNA binding protein
MLKAEEKLMLPQDSITIPQLADRLGISRIAVWNKVKKGEIPATQIGRQYVISARDARIAAGEELTSEQEQWIAVAVDRVVRKYGPVLKRLSRE